VKGDCFLRRLKIIRELLREDSILFQRRNKSNPKQ